MVPDMNEGWLNQEYLIIFTESEIESITERYGLPNFLPGYEVVGIRGWDDLIVRDSAGQTYTVPSVPLDTKYLAPYSIPAGNPEPEETLSGKIKWYVQPIAFGGDPDPGPNLTWVTHEQHGQLVIWWNKQYQALKSRRAT
jgi:hypothetical protein